MQVVYNLEEPPASWRRAIFLAGPSRREDDHGPSWRTEALDILRNEIRFEGVVFAPENRKEHAASPSALPAEQFSLDAQVAWETFCLSHSDAIVFWVPRSISGRLPGFTTNVEFGLYAFTNRCVLGYPLEAENMRYLRWWAMELGMGVCHDLTATLRHAANVIARWPVAGVVTNPAEEDLVAPVRAAGHRGIPLWLYTRADFRAWVMQSELLGNKIVEASVRWVLDGRAPATRLRLTEDEKKRGLHPSDKGFDQQLPQQHRRPFMAILHASVFIAAENRFKTNEIVLFRPDVSTVVLFAPAASGFYGDAKVVLVKEFRTPVRNAIGAVVESAGGSSWAQLQPGKATVTVSDDALECAAEEVEEETGLHVAPSRIQYLGSRQIASTLSAHQSHVFFAKITPEELQICEANAAKGVTFGVESDTERTSLAILTVNELLRPPVDQPTSAAHGVDWAALGTILAAVLLNTAS